MRWPWVSRRAYELLLEEREFLRGQIEALTRISRASHGLPEEPRKPKTKRPTDPVPVEILELIAGFGSGPVQSMIRGQVETMREAGTPYGEIEKILKARVGV